MGQVNQLIEAYIHLAALPASPDVRTAQLPHILALLFELLQLL